MTKKSETERHPLNSGIPCAKHGCIWCCIETRMPLSCLDVRRLLKMGYQLEDFATRMEEGWRLKNRSGRCVFLSESGCKIYPCRPEGCQLYPLVYDEDLRKAALDDLCPYGREFKVTKDDIRNLENLLGRLREEGRYISADP